MFFRVTALLDPGSCVYGDILSNIRHIARVQARSYWLIVELQSMDNSEVKWASSIVSHDSLRLGLRLVSRL